MKATIDSEATQEDFGITSKGYEDLGHPILKCSDCDKKLVTLQIVQKNVPFKTGPKTSIDKMKFRASCPYCGDKSFYKELERVKVFFIVEEGLLINNIKMKDDLTELEIIRKDKK